MKDAVRFAEAHAEALADYRCGSSAAVRWRRDQDEQPRQLGAARAPRSRASRFGALDREKLSFSERMIVKAVKAPDGDFRDGMINDWADEIAARPALAARLVRLRLPVG
jgi:hypothetical protein